MKTIEQYFHVVLFNVLYKVVLTFKSVDKTVVSCGAILSSSLILLSYFFLNMHVYISFVFVDEVYPFVSTTNAISLIADSRMTTSELLHGNSRDLH